MKKTYLNLFTLILGIALILSGCKPGGGVEPTPLVDLIKGKTWVLGNITNTSVTPNTNANSTFANFKLIINAAGTGGSITYDNNTPAGFGGAGVNVNVSYVVNNSGNTLQLSGTLGVLDGIWPTTPINVTATETTLSFTISLTNKKTGPGTFKFDLVRQ